MHTIYVVYKKMDFHALRWVAWRILAAIKLLSIRYVSAPPHYGAMIVESAYPANSTKFKKVLHTLIGKTYLISCFQLEPIDGVLNMKIVVIVRGASSLQKFNLRVRCRKNSAPSVESLLASSRRLLELYRGIEVDNIFILSISSFKIEEGGAAKAKVA